MNNDKNKNTQDTVSSEDSTTGSSDVSTASAGDSLAATRAEVTGAADSIKDSAQGLIDKAKDTAGQAYEMAAEKAAEKLDEQKAVVTSGLASVADSIKQVGETLRETDEQTGVTEITAKYGDRLAGQIEQISNYFEKNDLRGIVGDVEDFARKNPAVFIGGAFALGILAARFLKSSTPSAAETQSAPTAEGSGRSRSARRGKTAGGDNIVSFDSSTANKNVSPARDSVKDPI
jgi:ElaB/YqjD/DUF883 family membrane-anchored ribosome-binding protein